MTAKKKKVPKKRNAFALHAKKRKAKIIKPKKKKWTPKEEEE